MFPAAMRSHPGLTGGLIVSERLAAVAAERVGRDRAEVILNEAAARSRGEGGPLAEILAAEPALDGLDLDELTDPVRYSGCAGPLTDRALERR